MVLRCVASRSLYACTSNSNGGSSSSSGRVCRVGFPCTTRRNVLKGGRRGHVGGSGCRRNDRSRERFVCQVGDIADATDTVDISVGESVDTASSIAETLTLTDSLSESTSNSEPIASSVSDALQAYEALAGKSSSLSSTSKDQQISLPSFEIPSFGEGGIDLKAIESKVNEKITQLLNAFENAKLSLQNPAPGDGADEGLDINNIKLPSFDSQMPEFELPSIEFSFSLDEVSEFVTSFESRFTEFASSSSIVSSAFEFVQDVGNDFSETLVFKEQQLLEKILTISELLPEDARPAFYWIVNHAAGAGIAPLALLLAVVLNGQISSKLGYSGELSADQTIETLMKYNNALLVDLRSEADIVSNGIPSLRSSSRAKGITIPQILGSLSTIGNRQYMKNAIIDRRKVEMETVAIIVSGLRIVNRNTKLIFMDNRGGNGDAKGVARAMKRFGFRESFIVQRYILTVNLLFILKSAIALKYYRL